MSNTSIVESKTSLELVGTYIRLIRARFSGKNEGLPWQWSSKPEESSIVIESASNEMEEQRDAKPSIFVDRNAIVYPTIAIGNQVAEHQPSGTRYYYTTPSGQMTVDCISRSRGESSLIGDAVAHHLVMSGNILRRFYGFKSVTPVTLMPSQPWEKDDRSYITRVTSEFVYDIAWKSVPEELIIRRMKGIDIEPY
tara:strand:+ start:721 stop:1305 length:585 start_codon:yes stop_codon:yes gene_type:complete